MTVYSSNHLDLEEKADLEVIRLDYSLKRKITRNDWLLSASSQSLRLILSLRMNSKFITLRPTYVPGILWLV